MEAASGLEPESRGFADLRLNHLATPPIDIGFDYIDSSCSIKALESAHRWIPV
jgi:hypothetical protein